MLAGCSFQSAALWELRNAVTVISIHTLVMQLTRFADYSLRVLIFLAHRQGVHTTIRDVSDAHRISEDHLMKVVRRLAALGYIRATRGKNGGIGPARAAADISIGKVIRDIEPLTPVECFMPDYDGRCSLYPNCALRGALQMAQLQYLKTLDAFGVADVMGPDSFLAGAPIVPNRVQPARARHGGEKLNPGRPKLR
jgi:Rrf2 family nitric oxide-sensitive transcriptional repressor